MTVSATNTVQRPDNRQRAVMQAVVFQIAWLLCVLGGSLIALPVTMAVLTLHLWISERRWAYARFLLVTTLIGFGCDLLLVNSGVLQPGPDVRLQPLWLLCLWPLFATTVPDALHWFHGHTVRSMAAGALLAPLSYFGGSRLAGVELLQPTWLALLIIACCWALVFPGLISIYCRRFT